MHHRSREADQFCGPSRMNHPGAFPRRCSGAIWLFGAWFAVLLAGCGFQLRGVPPALDDARQWNLSGIDESSSFHGVLRTALHRAGVQLVVLPDSETVRLRILSLQTERRVASVVAGRAQEYEWVTELEAELQSAAQEEAIALQPLEVRRFLREERDALLGQADLEGEIRREMEQELARQLLLQVMAVLQRQEGVESGIP